MHETQKDATRASIEELDEPGSYEIRLKGHLDHRWTTWFEGLTLTREANGETLLAGPVVDQAALHGLLRKVRDLNLPLVAVTHVDPKPANAPDVNTDTYHNRSEKETNP
jgi:hypothetical protein